VCSSDLYLVHGVEGDRYAAGFKGNPYPAGAERDAINQAYDNFAATLKTRPGKDGRSALHEPVGWESVEGGAVRYETARAEPLDELPAAREHIAAGRDPGDWVMSQQARDGYEHLIAIQDGKALYAVTSQAQAFVQWSDDFARQMLDPQAGITTHHNHPSGRNFSKNDLLSLSMLGHENVVIHSERNGERTYARAALTPAVRAGVAAVNPIVAQQKLHRVLIAADSAVKQRLHLAVSIAEVDAVDASNHHHTLMALALNAAGVIRYSATHPMPPIGSAPAYMEAMVTAARAAQDKAKEVGLSHADATTADRYAESIRARIGVEPVRGEPGRSAAGRPSGEGGARGRRGGTEVPPGSIVDRLAETDAYPPAQAAGAAQDQGTVLDTAGVGLVGHASPRFAAKRAEVKADLQRLVRERAPGLNVEVFDRLTDMSGVEGNAALSGVSKAPMLEMVAYVALSAPDRLHAINHEIVHYLRGIGAFTEAEWRAMERRAPAWRKRFDIDERYAGQPEAILNEEAIAEAFSAWATGKVSAAELDAAPGIRSAWAWLKQMLVALGRALRMRGFQNPSDVFQAVASGQVGGRATVVRDSREQYEQVAPVDPEEMDRAFLAELLAERNITLTRNQLNEARGPLYMRAERVKGTEQQEAIMQAIGVRDRPEGPSIRERFAEMKRGWWDWVRQGMFDQYHAIAQLERGAFGALRDAAVSAYKFARMTPNIGSMMHVVLTQGPLEWSAGGPKVSTRPEFAGGFNAIFGDLAKRGLLPLWKAWAIANRANRLIREDRENLLTQDQIDALLPLAEQYPEFQDVMDRWTAFNKAMLDFAEGAGLIDPQARAIWEKNDYVPFYRLMDEGVGGPGVRKGLTGQSSGIRTLYGGEQAINDLIENMVMNMTRLVDASMKNEASRRTLDIARRVGAADPAARDWKVAHVSASEAAAKLKDIGVEVERMTAEQRERWLSLFTMVPPRDPGVVSVQVNGKPEYYRINDPLLLRALGSMQWSGYDSLLLSLAGKAKRLLTKGVVMFPDFMIANFIRDGVASWVITGGQTNPLKAAANLVAGFSDNDPRVVGIQAAGGDVTGWYETRPEDVRGQLERSLSPGGGPAGMARTLWQTWMRVGQASERANRLAVYDAKIAEGASPQEAAYQAMDLLDFHMRGDWAATRILTEVVPFMNARLQGLYRLGRFAAANPGAFFLRGAAITLPALALLFANWDDERYQAASDAEKDNYFFIPVGDTLVKIPSPFEVGAIFKTLPERVTRWWLGQDSAAKFGTRVGHVILDQLAMDPTPQIFKPLVEQMANRVGYTGAPIVSRDLERLRPEQQVGTNTSGFGRVLADLLPDILPDPTRSPVRIDHMVRAYLGTLGTTLLAGSTGVYNAVSGKEAAARRLEDTPVIGRFLTDRTKAPLSSVYVGDFYELTRKVEQYAASMKRLRQLGEVDAARELLTERRAEIQLRPFMDKVNDRMAGLNRQLRVARERADLTAEQRREEIDRLLAQRTQLAKTAVERAKQMGVE